MQKLQKFKIKGWYVLYNFNNKYYIFRQLSGRLVNVYYDTKMGICYSTLGRRDVWAEPVSIKKDAFQDLYVGMDNNENLSLIYQNQHGNIFYVKFNENSLTTLPILNSKSPSLYNKHLRLIPMGKDIHFFYILLYNKKVLLTHQILQDKKIRKPKVIDYVHKNNLPYDIVMDNLRNIYVFYQSTDNSVGQFGCKIIYSSKGTYGNFLPISPPGIICDFPSAIIDNSNTLHICFQKQIKDQYRLVYTQKDPNKALFTDEIVIHSSLYSFENSSIISIDEKIFIYWVRNDVIYFSFSKNGGSSWSKPAKYNFPINRGLHCIVYGTNVPHELKRLSIKNIPGSFTNGIRLAFYQDFLSSNIRVPNQEDFKIMISGSLKSLENNFDTLSKRIGAIENQGENLALHRADFTRELDKLSIRLSFLENSFKKLKSFTSQSNDNNTFANIMEENESKIENNTYNNMGDKNVRIKKFGKMKRFTKKSLS